MILSFNGIDLSTGTYYKTGCDLEAFVEGLPAPTPRNGHPALPEKGVIDGIDAEKIEEAGWGLLYHERDRHLLEAARPLLARRQNQARDLYRELVYREGESVSDFLFRQGIGMGEVNPRKVPFYLLILGDPHHIPFDFQCDLALVHAVGRLSFSTVDGYARYARNVADYERNGPRTRRELLMCPMNNGDDLTELSRKELVFPLLQSLIDGGPERRGAWRPNSLSDCRRRNLIQKLSDETPDVLFTAGHGLCVSMDEVSRAKFQGSLVCNDWQASQAIAYDHCLSPADVAEMGGLDGMIGFLFACFSAGTPRFDSYAQKRRELHRHAFVSPFAQALLQAGALAVIGHVDQAYWHSFLWHDQVREIQHFSDTLSRLMAGRRVGTAMEPFGRRYATISTLLAGRMFSPDPPPLEEIQLLGWLAFQDARQYVVLGDPAARLGYGSDT